MTDGGRCKGDAREIWWGRYREDHRGDTSAHLHQMTDGGAASKMRLEKMVASACPEPSAALRDHC